MRTLVLIALSAATIGCGNTPLDRRADVRFELRPLVLKSSETEYATTFTREGTIVAIGDSAAAQRPYLVVLNVTHVSGGDPEQTRNKEEMILIPVQRGAGDVAISGGYRPKKTSYQEGKTWQPADYRVSVIGYIPVVTPR